ncbi:hypothetical protein M0Q97_03015 [Candidatus Dojkabacteria bacterium]|jgi:hypothetical protein|nr:hypothetical protein [Candidatus Dojkabacteria bacterium]
MNKNIFQKIDSNKAYILGFLWADGYVSKNMVGTEGSSKDFENLNKIITKSGNWIVGHRERFLKKTGKYYKQSYFHYYSKLTSDFLKCFDYDIKSHTEPIKILNYITPKYHYHFFRGYIDGDGSFSFYKGTNGTTMQCKFNITSSKEQNWNFIEKLFATLEINHCLINRYDRKAGKSSIISINNKWDIIKLGEYLYIDSNDKLERKYNKYLQIKNSDVKKCANKWNIEDTNFLIENYEKYGVEYCSEKLNRTVGSIYTQYHRNKHKL